MSRNFNSILVLSLLALFGCQPKKVGVYQPPTTGTTTPDPISPPMISYISTGPWADTVAKYRPVLGKAGISRQTPFGLANRPPSTIRLVKITTNGKLTRTYQYDAEGKLTERLDYHTNGEYIYGKTSYRYAESRLTQQIIFLNKEYDRVESFPKSNDLVQGGKVDFATAADSLSWIVMTYKVDLSPYKNQIGTRQSNLGYGPDGALVWQMWNNGTEYELFRRESTGNITLHRYGATNGSWSASALTYDNHPNPFRTTGDFQTRDVFDFDASNTNNPLTMDLTNYLATMVDRWRYAYDYRPDGYPNKVTLYRNGEVERTIEFTYNQ